MLNRDTKTKNDYLLENGCKLDHKIKSSYFKDKSRLKKSWNDFDLQKLFYRTAETQNCLFFIHVSFNVP
jgi:hypothetical protein